jgi:hypothetical protein
MSTRGRRIGFIGLLFLTTASLLRTSISLAFLSATIPYRDLNFRLSRVSLTRAEGGAGLPSPSSIVVQRREPGPQRVRRAIRTRVQTLSFETIVQNSTTLPVGSTRVITEGATGRALRTEAVTYRGGRVVSRQLLSYVLLTRPLPRVEIRGTDSTRLGEEPTHIQYGEASWYQCSGMYAAHLALPFGTVVTVTDLDNGRAVTVVINDRGPYGIADRIIDLCSPAFAQIAPLAQGVARVEISW